MPRLRRADPSRPGIARRGHGRGFSYLTPAGRPLRDADTLARIRSLAIPPAWREVWISDDPLGHLQATGVDAAGRRQYLYHPLWRERRDRQKFEDMLCFARSLPQLRRAVTRDLSRELLDRERVLACAVRLLDRGLFRVGSDTYAEQNGSFGLATIHREHVRVGRGELTFDYPAKSGVRRVHAVRDPLVTEAVCELKRRRSGSQRLLAYRAGRRWHEIHSDDVNGYLREHAGCHCSAKDFRTWNATVLAALELARLGPAPRGSQAALRRAVSHTAAAVASQLGNTPAVCRSSYIDPRVFDRYRAGVTVDAGRIEPGELLGHDRARHVLERAVLALLD